MSADPVASKRKAFLALALRRAQPGSGSASAFLQNRTWGELPVALDLECITTPYLIVGGIATALYMPQRLTLDLNLLVVADDAPVLYRELVAAAYTQTGTLSIGRTNWRTPDGGVLDVIESREPWAPVAVRTPNRSPAGEPVIALPYLVLMKLVASRPQDLADLSRMLGAADEAMLDQVREAVRMYRPEDSADLESLITLGRLELAAGDAQGAEDAPSTPDERDRQERIEGQ